MGMIIPLNIHIQPDHNLPHLWFNTFTNNTAWRRFIVWLKTGEVSTEKNPGFQVVFPSRFITCSFILKPTICLQTARSSQILFHICVQNNTAMLDFTVTILYHNTVALGVQFCRIGSRYFFPQDMSDFEIISAKHKLLLKVYLWPCLLHFQVFSFPQERTHMFR